VSALTGVSSDIIGPFIGDIVLPGNSSFSSLGRKKTEEFDVRDTMSEPRVGYG
jgi:hypothetical protein